MKMLINFIRKLYIHSLLLFFSFSCTLERRLLSAPQLGEDKISKKIDCYRPVRKNGPALFLEEKGNKILLHNYGHGGGGWSIAPGCAKYITKLLNNKLRLLNKNTSEPITIVGVGVVGLFMAYELIKNGYTNITIIAENFKELPSNYAGGLWAPFHIGDVSNRKKLFKQIGIDSYKFFLNLQTSSNKLFCDCARLMPAYFLRKNEDLKLFIGNVMKPPKRIIANFGNGTTRKMYVYDDMMIINTPLMMQKLTEFAIKHNVRFKKKKISSFKEVKSKIIINCSGYGAKQLCNDKTLTSIQGHLLVLKGQNPKKMNYLMTVPYDQGYVNGFKITRLIYIIPRHDPGAPKDQIGVLGGTLVEGAEKDNKNIEEFPKIIKRAREFYGIK